MAKGHLAALGAHHIDAQLECIRDLHKGNLSLSCVPQGLAVGGGSSGGEGEGPAKDHMLSRPVAMHHRP